MDKGLLEEIVWGIDADDEQAGVEEVKRATIPPYRRAPKMPISASGPGRNCRRSAPL